MTKYGPWLPWDGGECPVDPKKTKVQTQLASESRLQAQEKAVQPAHFYDWSLRDCDAAITSYRKVIEPVVTTVTTENTWMEIPSCRLPEFFNRMENKNCVRGTLITTNTDGKNTRIVWEADE